MAKFFYMISGSAGVTSSAASPTLIMHPAVRPVGFVGTASATQPGTAVATIMANTAGGTPLSWLTPPSAGGPFTFSGSATMSLWGIEAAANNNATFGFRLWHKSGSLQGTGSETAMMTTVVSSSVELGFNSVNLTVVTASISNTVFNKNDRIVLRVYTTGVAGVAMGSGTTTMYYGGTAAGVSGESYLQFSQDFPVKQKMIVSTPSQ